MLRWRRQTEEAASKSLSLDHTAAGARSVVASLERGMSIGLLSNTHWPRTFHEHFLERDGLAGSIDARFYTSELEFVKPHPSVFAAVLAALGVGDPSRARGRRDHVRLRLA